MTVVDGYSHSTPTTKVNGSKLLTHQWPKPHIFGVRICICIYIYIYTYVYIYIQYTYQSIQMRMYTNGAIANRRFWGR